MNHTCATLAQYYHTLDPVLVQLGPVAIRWYGLAYVASFIAAYFTLTWLARRGAIRIPAHRVGDAMLAMILGVLIGGRLGYAIIYDRDLLTTVRPSFPFWDLLAIQRGGMASHGGIIGVMIAALWVTKGFKNDRGDIEGRCTWFHVVDLLALCAPFGFFVGRLANFINGELLGRVIAPPGQPAPWYAVRFPQELLFWNTSTHHTKEGVDLTPEQLGQLQQLVHEHAKPGESWGASLASLVEMAGRYRDKLVPLVSARHPSQLYAMLLEGLATGIVIWFLAARPRKAGVIGASWLITYGIVRVIDEIWRLPDAQFDEGRPMGLSRGQWLSVAMIVGGAVSLLLVLRRNKDTTGGWRIVAPIS